MGRELATALADLEEEKVHEIVTQRLKAGDDPYSLLEELRDGLSIVGERYNKNEYFLSELIMSGEIFKEATSLIEPLLKTKPPREALGKVVIGTPQGDIHDMGKNIVVMLLRGAGFEVFDLGVDVAPQTFLEKLQKTQASILGFSALMTPSFMPMKETVEALKKAGLRGKVKVIIGGGVTNEMVREYVGADAQPIDGMEGVEICRKFVRGDRA